MINININDIEIKIGLGTEDENPDELSLIGSFNAKIIYVYYNKWIKINKYKVHTYSINFITKIIKKCHSKNEIESLINNITD